MKYPVRIEFANNSLQTLLLSCKMAKCDSNEYLFLFPTLYHKKWQYIYLYIGKMVWVFTNGPGDRDSIPGRVIPQTQKMVLDPSLLNTQYCTICIKGKVEKSRERSSVLPTRWCSSYWKGSLRGALHYVRQLYLKIEKQGNPKIRIWFKKCQG